MISTDIGEKYWYPVLCDHLRAGEMERNEFKAHKAGRFVNPCARVVFAESSSKREGTGKVTRYRERRKRE